MGSRLDSWSLCQRVEISGTSKPGRRSRGRESVIATQRPHIGFTWPRINIFICVLFREGLRPQVLHAGSPCHQKKSLTERRTPLLKTPSIHRGGSKAVSPFSSAQVTRKCSLREVCTPDTPATPVLCESPAQALYHVLLDHGVGCSAAPLTHTGCYPSPAS